MGSLKRDAVLKLLASCSLLLVNGVFINSAHAEQQYASKERATIARAHVSRARALLVEALAEFEESKKYARPDLLLDPEDWRLRVISLTEQLNRVIDPKPRVTREGAVFRTPPRFIKRDREQLPVVAGGAKSRSDVGEKERLRQKQQERARFFDENDKSKSGAENKELTRLPKELQLPDEPALDLPSEENEANKNAGERQKQPKDLFSNDLMPEVDEGEGSGSRETTQQEDRFKELPPAKANKASSILPPPEAGSFEDLEMDEETKKQEVEALPDTGRAKKKGSAQEDSNAVLGNQITPKAVPSVLEEEEALELSPEEAAKRAAEDEALARRLEESITERLTNRNANKN